MLAGCSQPQKKTDQSPTAPQPQTNMMGQAAPSSMMHDNPEAMQKAMSAPENRQAMTDIMADPTMKDTFAAMVKDPRLAPIAREALKQ
jgi:uncharacterized lipoprotein YajG